MFGRRRSQPAREPTPQTVATECEAFLSGHLAERYEEWGRPVPCWAYLNQLAHCSLTDLEALATSDAAPASRLSAASWHYALKRLATQLVETIDDPAALRRCQQEALWPLEDVLIKAHDGPIRTPGELFRVVLGVLEEDHHAPS